MKLQLVVGVAVGVDVGLGVATGLNGGQFSQSILINLTWNQPCLLGVSDGGGVT